MRVMAGGGIGALVAMVVLLISGGVVAATNNGNFAGGALMFLVCFGGFAIPLGFLLGCWGGAIVAAIHRSRAASYTPRRERVRLDRRWIDWRFDEEKTPSTLERITYVRNYDVDTQSDSTAEGIRKA